MKINGIHLNYAVKGSGKPLVLIAGLGGDLGFWEPSLKFLKEFQVITYDCRGGGASEMAPPPYSMELFADDLSALLDELKIEKASILGFSMGGNIAQSFALKYPHKVDKLILAATFAHMNTQVRLFIDAVVSVYEAGCTPKQMFDLIAPWLFSESFLNGAGNESYLRFNENDPNLQPLKTWKGQYLAQREFDSRKKLGQIEMETLIIAGEEDRLAHVTDSRTLHSGIKDSQLMIMQDAGHLMNYEQPELFHEIVVNFLELGHLS